MTENIKTLLTGALGSASVYAAGVVSESADQIVAVTTGTMPSPDDVANAGQLVIQILIGIVTLWRLIKKPKPKKDEH